MVLFSCNSLDFFLSHVHVHKIVSLHLTIFLPMIKKKCLSYLCHRIPWKFHCIVFHHPLAILEKYNCEPIRCRDLVPPTPPPWVLLLPHPFQVLFTFASKKIWRRALVRWGTKHFKELMRIMPTLATGKKFITHVNQILSHIKNFVERVQNSGGTGIVLWALLVLIWLGKLKLFRMI